MAGSNSVLNRGYGNGVDGGYNKPNITPQEGFDTLMGQNLDFDYISAGESTETNRAILYFQVFSDTAKITAIERKKNDEWISANSIYTGIELEVDRGFYGGHRNITVEEGTIIVFYSRTN